MKVDSTKMKFFFWGMGIFFLGLFFYLQLILTTNSIPFLNYLAKGLVGGLFLSIFFYGIFMSPEAEKGMRGFLTSNRVKFNKSTKKPIIFLFSFSSLLFAALYFLLPHPPGTLMVNPVFDFIFSLIFIIYGLGLMFRIIIPK